MQRKGKIVQEIIDKAFNTHILEKNEISSILKNDDCNDYLFKKADETKKKYYSNKVYLRGLIEFSNICNNNCKYCGIRHENKKINRFMISIDEIYTLAKSAIDAGYKTIVLQSGENSVYNPLEFAKLIEKIKKFNVAVTLSVGEKSFEEYELYKKAGADRYLLRIETTDKNLYEKMHPNMSFENRLKCLKNLKTLGYETGTGVLIGLPGQTVDSLAEDLLFFKDINAEMVGLGPFIPSNDTPLANERQGSFYLSLKMLALTRLLLPSINIPATTAMEVLHEQGRLIALHSGANVIMPNVTSYSKAENYQIYPNKPLAQNDILIERKKIEADFEQMGMIAL